MNELISGLANAIKSAFPTSNVYFQKVEQSLELPAFFIDVPSVMGSKKVNGRKETEYEISILYYHSDVDDYKSEILQTAITLESILDVIIVDSKPVRGINGKIVINGDLLRCLINYVLVTRPIPDTDRMEIVDIDVGDTL